MTTKSARDRDCRRVRFMGMRTFKTVLSALLAALLMRYVFHATPFFACIGAVVAVEKTRSRSLRAVLVRNIGTLTGGLMGIAISTWTSNIFLISLGLAPMIYIDNLLRRQDSIVVGAIVYFAVTYLNTGGGAVAYGLSRIAYTFIGSMIGLAVNMLICPPRDDEKTE